MAYACFLRDEYPPFGDGPYPAWLELPDEPETRDFKSVALRPLLLLPHLLVLFALLVVDAARLHRLVVPASCSRAAWARTCGGSSAT